MKNRFEVTLEVLCFGHFFNIFFFFNRLSKHIPMAALQAGFNLERAKNSEKEFELTVALPTKRTLNVIVRVPEVSGQSFLNTY